MSVGSCPPAESVVPLSWLAGDHPGFVLNGLHVVAAGARQPVHLWSSLRLPAVAGGIGGVGVPVPAEPSGRVIAHPIGSLPGA